MSLQRRTALVSVVLAAALVVLKLTVGLAANSLGLVSEAVHSGTDLVAALLTFLALGVSGRPPDVANRRSSARTAISTLAAARKLASASADRCSALPWP